MICAYSCKNGYYVWPHIYDGTMHTRVIKHTDKSIMNPASFPINKMRPIHSVDESQMIVVALNTMKYMQLSDIMLFASHINNGILLDMIKNNISGIFRTQLNCLRECPESFKDDIIKEKFSNRRWPYSTFSPQSWKDLVAANSTASNWMISLVSAKIEQSDSDDGEMPYDFLRDIIDSKMSDALRAAVENGDVKKFAAIAGKMSNNYIVSQYIIWLATTPIPEKFHKFATSLGAMQIERAHGANWINNVDKKYDFDVFEDLSKHINLLNGFYSIGMYNEFMTYLCTILSLPSYILMLREIEIISRMTNLMEEHPVFADMVAIAMSYVMYYATRIEQDTSRYRASIDDPFVFTADMVAAFPRFSNDPPGVNPYFQIGFDNPKIFIPWVVVNSNRQILPTEEVVNRINIFATGSKSTIKFTEIVPWQSMKLTLTGSKLGSAVSINPKEHLFKSVDEFVEKHLITATEYIKKMMDRYRENHNGDVIVKIDPKKDGDEADSAMAELYEACRNDCSDFDIAFGGDDEDYDKIAIDLVQLFKEHGEAFMIRREKKKGYSWMIFVEYLNYPIDLFHSYREPIQLIRGFMTAYPRAYFDGMSVIMTSHFIAARLAGVNLTYESMMLNDPCEIMFKSMTQELVTLMMSIYEKSVFEQWLVSKGIDQKPIYGNVTVRNPIFWIKKEPESPTIDFESHWLKTKRMTPVSKKIMNIFEKGKFHIPDISIFAEYYADLNEIKDRKK